MTSTERPIIFGSPMVKALLAGRKTQTRRLVKPQPAVDHHYLQPMFGTSPDGFAFGTPGLWREVGPDYPDGDDDDRRCPYGAPGDRLWVKETWHPCDGGALYQADYRDKQEAGIERWQSPLYMPRNESRITLELTSVRVERIKDTSPADIIAEGVVDRPHEVEGLGRCPVSAFDGICYPDLLSLWRAGWDSINGKCEPFASNPWVWVLEFRRMS
jgi:hypothetical protein